MTVNARLHVVHGALKLSLWSRVEWRYALGLFTTAFFLLGTLTLSRLILPNHPNAAESSALAVTAIWRVGLHKLKIFPWDWSRARGSSFSLLQALIDGFSFFAFMLVILTSGTRVTSRAALLAAVAGLAYGVYCGSFGFPEERNS